MRVPPAYFFAPHDAHMEVSAASWRAHHGGGSAEMRLTIANG